VGTSPGKSFRSMSEPPTSSPSAASPGTPGRDPRPPQPQSAPIPSAGASAAPGGAGPASPFRRRLPAILIAIQLVAGLLTAAAKCTTFDECWHLPVGLLNLREHRFDYDILNPPLARMWCAIPLYVSGVQAKAVSAQEGVGTLFQQDHVQNYRWLYFWGRLPNVVLACLLSWLLYRYALHFLGSPGAEWTLLLCVTCPNLLAHASVVTTDVPAAVTMTAATLWLSRWVEMPDNRGALLWGLALGAGWASKYTALMLLPFPVVAAVLIVGMRRASVLAAGRQLVLGIVTALAVLNVCYLFQGTGRSLRSYTFESKSMTRLQQRTGFLASLPLPVPRDFVQGLDTQQRMLEHEHPVFLNGEWTTHGSRDYFLYALLYKLPHLLQIAFVGGFVAAVSRGGAQRWQVLWLLAPGLLLLVIASLTPMQLGIRYVLPSLPMMYLFGGYGISVILNSLPKARPVFVPLVAVVALASLRYHPDHLPYFNELAGGPLGGRSYLADSNLDWGQDLYGLRDWMKSANVPSVYLAYFGTVSPTLAGVRFAPPPDRFRPGVYAISANLVLGRPSVIPLPDGSTRSVDAGALMPFQVLNPIERAGYSIDIYRVTEADLPALEEARRFIERAR